MTTPPDTAERTRIVADVRARVRALQALRPVRPVDVRAHARDVVLLGSSSRGGSTVVAEMLRQVPGTLHLRAELNPFLALDGRVHPSSGTGSDALPAVPPDTLAALGSDLAWEVGSPAEGFADDAEVWQFALDLACRLSLQWPLASFGADEVHDAVRVALGVLGGNRPFEDPARFQALFLHALAPAHPEIDPGYYDIGRDVLAAVFPGRPAPVGPPGPVLLEEPPFVCIRPWRLASAEALRTRPLVVKTPSNAYRLPFLRALFPAAELRVLHLARNVAASVNGLVDGWRYPGFWSHHVGAPAGVPGALDATGGWWKFDLPPGWEAYREAPLVDICAFQWRSAHAHFLDALDAQPEMRRLRVRFEDLLGPGPARLPAFAALGDALGTPVDPALVDLLPPVMATARPRQRRWCERAPELERVLADPANLEIMERLGYARDPATWT